MCLCVCVIGGFGLVFLFGSSSWVCVRGCAGGCARGSRCGYVCGCVCRRGLLFGCFVFFVDVSLCWCLCWSVFVSLWGVGESLSMPVCVCLSVRLSNLYVRSSVRRSVRSYARSCFCLFAYLAAWLPACLLAFACLRAPADLPVCLGVCVCAGQRVCMSPFFPYSDIVVFLSSCFLSFCHPSKLPPQMSCGQPYVWADSA